MSEYERLLSELRTDLQRQFVKHYISTLNATEAAARAGYKGKRHTHAVIGSENLRKPEIKAAVDAGLEAHGKISENELLTRLSKIAAGDISDYLEYHTIKRATNQGKLYDVEIMRFNLEKFKADGLGMLIKRIKNLSNGGVDIEFHDPVKALELLGRHYSSFVDRVDVEGGVEQRWVLDWPPPFPQEEA